jgi:hypothetical protein
MIGGKVLDPGAVAAYASGSITMVSWLTVADSLGIVMYVPALALTEVETVRPLARPLLASLVGQSMVVRGKLTTAAAISVDQMLARTGTWDATAGHVVHTSNERGWTVLSGDPGRLRRVDPGVDVDAV